MKQEPKIFRLFEDFLIAEKLIIGLDKQPHTPAYEQKIRSSFLQINDLIEIELDRIVNNAPEIENEDGTSEATSGSL